MSKELNINKDYSSWVSQKKSDNRLTFLSWSHYVETDNKNVE